MNFTQLLNREKHSGCAVHAYLCYIWLHWAVIITLPITFQLGIHWLHFLPSRWLDIFLYIQQILPFNVVFLFLSLLSFLLLSLVKFFYISIFCMFSLLYEIESIVKLLFNWYFSSFKTFFSFALVWFTTTRVNRWFHF